MKKNALLTTALFICSTSLCFLLTSCNSSSSQYLDEMTVVAERITKGGSDLISCDVTKLENTVDLPLSFFTEEMQIVRLDNQDEALVGGGATIITDNYILVRNDRQNPYKLFDIKGKFIASIGAYGQGPDEYLNVYDDYLDEKTGEIFILPWSASKILRFDLKGNPLTHIPLKYRVPKGKFIVDAKNQTVSIMALPFKGSVPLVVWKQDFEGTILDSIPAAHLTVDARNAKGQFVGYNNEVHSNKNSDAFDCAVFCYESRADSLYNYSGEGKLDAKFTLDFKDQALAMHWYAELPKHFLGTISADRENSNFLVDKKTLKGSYYKLFNDFLGNLPMNWTSFNNGYYVSNNDPGRLSDQITKHLEENPEIEENDRKKLTDLLNSIDDNDNNYVFHAKLKK